MRSAAMLTADHGSEDLSILIIHSAAFPKLRLGQGVHMSIPCPSLNFMMLSRLEYFSLFQDTQVLVDKA